jgi:hypothetical protein
MWRATIFKQNNLPTPPMAADHLEKSLVRILIPNFGNQQGHIAGANIDRAVNHSPSMTAANRNTLLFTDPRVTTIERRSLGNNSFIEH